MSDIKPELIEKAADIIVDALEDHGHNGSDCRPDVGMDLYATAATRAALSAVADDLRAEGAVQALRDFADRQDSWCAEGRAEQVISRRSMRDALRAQAARIECGGVAHVLYQAAKDTESVSEQAIREAKAEAWGEGHRTPQQREMDDCRCHAYYAGECACGRFGTGRIITPNPYRQEARDE